MQQKKENNGKRENKNNWKKNILKINQINGLYNIGLPFLTRILLTHHFSTNII